MNLRNTGLVASFLILVILMMGVTCAETDHLSTDQQSSPQSLQQIMGDQFREKDRIILAYDQSQALQSCIQSFPSSLRVRRNHNLPIVIKKFDELTDSDLKQEILWLIGDINHLTSSAFKDGLPFHIQSGSYIVTDQKFDAKDHLLKVNFYPNTFNDSIPLFFIHSEDSQEIIDFIDNYKNDWSRFWRRNHGYEVSSKGNLKMIGQFCEDYSAVDLNQHRNFPLENPMVENAHFKIISLGSDVNSDLAIEILEGMYQRFNNLYPVGHPIQLTCKFYPSIESKGLQLHSTTPSQLKYQNHTLHLVENGIFHSLDWGDVFRNFIINKWGQDLHPALEWGLATWLSENWEGKGFKYYADRLITSDNLPQLNEILDEENWANGSPWITHIAAASLIDYLLTSGPEHLLSRFNEVINGDWEDITKEWHAFAAKSAIIMAKEKTPLPSKHLMGFNFTHEGYRIYNGYGSELSKLSIQRLAEIGCNAISIIPYSFIRDPHQPSPLPIMSNTGGETDEAVIFSGYHAAQNNLYTVLKPQLWLGGGNWPGDVEMKSEEDWEMFFTHYYKWIRHYTMIAQIYNFDAICIGTELVRTTLKKPDEWKKMIKKIKGLYDGHVTYAANWGQEFENLSITDDLDFVGLDCYYPLSDRKIPPRKELEKNFDKVVKMMKVKHQLWSKPVCLTEIGFRSVNNPWNNPHDDANGRPYNADHQAICYEIVMQRIQSEKEWLNGCFWWKWPSYLEHRDIVNTDFSPSNKPAEDVIKKYFTALK